jgi:tetratricopeptide (TPR) repeat protein
MNKQRRLKISSPAKSISIVASTIILFTSVVSLAFAQEKPPYDKDRLLKVVSLNVLSTKEIIDAVNTRGVDFRVTPQIETEFKQAGARPEIIEALRRSYRAPKPAGNTSSPNTGSTSTTPPPKTNVPPGPPLSKNEIVTMLQGGLTSQRVGQFVEARGVAFTLTPDITREIMAAGGTRELLGAIAARGTTGRSNPPSNPPANTRPNPGPDYDDLNYQAIAAMKANNVSEAVRLLQQAIRVDPSRPTAYQVLGFTQLYGYQNIASAEQSFRQAIERNGAGVFQVYHDHDNFFQTYCQGSLLITKTGVTFNANDGVHKFEAQDAMIKEVSLNDFVGANFGGFHIKVREGEKGKARNFNFAPLTQKKQESTLIINLIRSY